MGKNDKSINENINLCNLLKGHEGEMFYSPMCGELKFSCMNSSLVFPLIFEIPTLPGWRKTFSFTIKGKISLSDDAECLIFPSKNQRDWNKWAEEQKPKIIKTPKTWSELAEGDLVEFPIVNNTDLIVKSAHALLI